MSLLSRLLTRRWLTATALAVAFAVVAGFLGTWQWSRHEEKVAARDRVETHYTAEPRPLTETVTGTDGRVTADQEWLRVEAEGRYLTDEQLLVRNRPHHGVYGYEVLVPLRVEGPGEGADPSLTVLVDRGWVPNAADASTLPEVPPAPEGPVTVRGWLRPGEQDLDRQLPAGQVASISPAAAEGATGLSLVDGYLVLEAEQPREGSGAGADAAPDRPEPLQPPRTELGAHLAYAIQWWLTAPVGLVLVGVLARREHREATGATSAEPRPRRRRIWDEEDE